MTYLISRGPSGRHRWWTEEQRIPPTDTGVRRSTAEEDRAIDHILDLDRRNRMIPYGLGVNIRDLMARNDPENKIAQDLTPGRSLP